MTESHWRLKEFRYAIVTDNELINYPTVDDDEARLAAVILKSCKSYRANLVYIGIDRMTGAATKKSQLK